MICYCKIQIITFDDFSHRLYVLRQLSFHSMMIHRPILHTYIVYSTIQLQCWDNIKNVTKYSLSVAFYRLHDRVPIHIPLIGTVGTVGSLQCSNLQTNLERLSGFFLL